MLRGNLPRSPVWLRKIPSTVSGSQGSRRGLRPAVRFAFPLGARLNITLRARPCQELFSESFCRPSRGPRGASRLRGLGPSRRRVRYYTLPRRGAGGKPSRTQDADNSSAAERKEGGIGRALRPAPQPRRFAPAHRRGRFSFLYISKEIGTRLRAGSLPRRHASRASPCRRLSPARFRQASRGGDSLPKEERPPPGPPAFRAGNPLGDRPWSILSIHPYRDIFSSDCRRCAWSSLPNAATRPWGRPSLQACSQSSP